MADTPRPQPSSEDPNHGRRSPEAAAHSDATDVTAYLLAGPLAFGLIGRGLDHLWSTSFLLPVGLVTGLLLSLYVVWVRYGRG